MEILALFDANGRKVSGKMEGVHYKTPEERQLYIDEGFIPIAEDDLTLYSQGSGGANGTGYIRDAETGKPVDAPPYVPSREEQVNILFSECQADLKIIDAQIVNAIILEDDELVAELKQERADRVEQYQHDLDELGV